MNMESQTAGAPGAEFSPEEMHAALFAQLVMQQANMAMMLLGKVPHPETGQPVRDLEAAKYFIDQLEMLEVKTKGNLSKEEQALLKQSLMTLRLAFVETVNEPAPPPAKPGETPAPAAAPAAASPAAPEDKTSPKPDAAAAPEEESRKRYSKKY